MPQNDQATTLEQSQQGANSSFSEQDVDRTAEPCPRRYQVLDDLKLEDHQPPVPAIEVPPPPALDPDVAVEQPPALTPNVETEKPPALAPNVETEKPPTLKADVEIKPPSPAEEEGSPPSRDEP